MTNQSQTLERGRMSRRGSQKKHKQCTIGFNVGLKGVQSLGNEKLCFDRPILLFTSQIKASSFNVKIQMVIAWINMTTTTNFEAPMN